jgi:thiol:disulfide interchange protein
MSIVTVSTEKELDGILNKDPEKLTVIDFKAEWCG